VHHFPAPPCSWAPLGASYTNADAMCVHEHVNNHADDASPRSDFDVAIKLFWLSLSSSVVKL